MKVIDKPMAEGGFIIDLNCGDAFFCAHGPCMRVTRGSYVSLRGGGLYEIQEGDTYSCQFPNAEVHLGFPE